MNRAGYDIACGVLKSPFQERPWLRPIREVLGHKTTEGPEVFFGAIRGVEFQVVGLGKTSEDERGEINLFEKCAIQLLEVSGQLLTITYHCEFASQPSFFVGQALPIFFGEIQARNAKYDAVMIWNLFLAFFYTQTQVNDFIQFKYHDSVCKITSQILQFSFKYFCMYSRPCRLPTQSDKIAHGSLPKEDNLLPRSHALDAGQPDFVPSGGEVEKTRKKYETLAQL